MPLRRGRRPGEGGAGPHEHNYGLVRTTMKPGKIPGTVVTTYHYRCTNPGRCYQQNRASVNPLNKKGIPEK